MFDIQTLTLGEVARVEELAGHAIGEFGEDSTPKGKMMAALAFVVHRRQGHPEFTWAAALELTMPEAKTILGMDDDEDEAAEAPEAGPTV